MIKTKDGLTTASGSKKELLKDFTVIAESLLRKTTITAEELYEAVKVAEKIIELITSIGEYFGTFKVPNAKDEPAQAEEKSNAKKGAVKATELEDDDLKGMMEWLKGELENLEDESDD